MKVAKPVKLKSNNKLSVTSNIDKIQKKNSDLSTKHKKYHEKAVKYLKELTDNVYKKSGKEKLNQLYDQVDTLKTVANGFEGYSGAFEECADYTKANENKEHSKLRLVLLFEEVFDIITGQFFDRLDYNKILGEYQDGIVNSYERLDKESKELVGELYSDYLPDKAFISESENVKMQL